MSDGLERDHPAPPVGEEIHIPGPSALPVVCAFGITLAVIGTTISPILSVAGLVILVIAVVRWIGDVRRDIAELPPDHSGEH